MKSLIACLALIAAAPAVNAQGMLDAIIPKDGIEAKMEITRMRTRWRLGPVRNRILTNRRGLPPGRTRDINIRSRISAPPVGRPTSPPGMVRAPSGGAGT